MFFGQRSQFISEMVQDRPTVAADHLLRVTLSVLEKRDIRWISVRVLVPFDQQRSNTLMLTTVGVF